MGKISLNSHFCSPRSNTLRGLLTRAEYASVVKAGDFGHGVDVAEGLSASVITEQCIISSFVPTPDRYNLIDNRRLAKCYLERDRNMWAEEHGYRTWMFECWPPSCTPKNDIIIGIHTSRMKSIELLHEWVSEV